MDHSPLSHQDVPFPLTGSTEGEGDLGLVRGVLPGVKVDVLASVETTDRRSVVTSPSPGTLHITQFSTILL